MKTTLSSFSFSDDSDNSPGLPTISSSLILHRSYTPIAPRSSLLSSPQPFSSNSTSQNLL